LSAVGESDYVLNSVEFNNEVDYVVKDQSSEINFEISTSNVPDPSKDKPVALVQIYEDGEPVGEPIEVERDEDGKGKTTYQADGAKEVSAEVIGFKDGFDFIFVDVNLDFAKAEL